MSLTSRADRRGRAAAFALILSVLVASTGCQRQAGTSARSGISGPDAGSSTPSPPAGPAVDWEWAPPRPANVGVPAVDAEGIVATYGRSRLVALDSRGRKRWEVERVGLRDVVPRLVGGLVLAATDDGVVAVDRGTGRLRWDAKLGERANTPAVAGATALVSTWEGSLVALVLADGAVAWQSRLPGLALGPAAAYDGTAFVSWEAENGSAAGISASDAGTGRERWRFALRRGGVSAPGVVPPAPGSVGATVVVVDATVAAHGIDAGTGARRWTTVLAGAGSPEIPPLAVAPGAALVTHRLGGLALLDTSDGAARWEVAADSGAAVHGGPVGPTSGGRFVLPLDDGTLLLTSPEATPDGAFGHLVDPPGRVSGVAMSGDRLLVATRESGANALYALTGW